MATKTELLRAGLIAKGWSRVKEYHHREAYTKAIKNVKTGQMEEVFMFLGHGTLRWNKRLRISDAMSLSDSKQEVYVKAGRESLGQPNIDELFSGLED